MTNESVELKAHKRIWLQQEGETTWCQDKINDDDIEYVLATPPQSPEAKDCKWSQDINDEYYDSECGLAWQMMNDDSLEDNKMNYCPKCGGKIVCETDKEEDKNG